MIIFSTMVVAYWISHWRHLTRTRFCLKINALNLLLSIISGIVQLLFEKQVDRENAVLTVETRDLDVQRGECHQINGGHAPEEQIHGSADRRRHDRRSKFVADTLRITFSPSQVFLQTCFLVSSLYSTSIRGHLVVSTETWINRSNNKQ